MYFLVAFLMVGLYLAAKVEKAKILFKEKDTHSALAQLIEVTNAAPQIAENWQLLASKNAIEKS